MEKKTSHCPHPSPAAPFHDLNLSFGSQLQLIICVVLASDDRNLKSCSSAEIPSLNGCKWDLNGYKWLFLWDYTWLYIPFLWDYKSLWLVFRANSYAWIFCSGFPRSWTVRIPKILYWLDLVGILYHHQPTGASNTDPLEKTWMILLYIYITW